MFNLFCVHCAQGCNWTPLELTVGSGQQGLALCSLGQPPLAALEPVCGTPCPQD